MPFRRRAPAFAHQRFTAFWQTEPCKGEQENGDGLFIEVGRMDGTLLLLLVDVTGQGAAAALTVELPKHVYPQAVLTLSSRQQVLAFTDGVSEAGGKGVSGQFQHDPLQAFFGQLPAGGTTAPGSPAQSGREAGGR
jgi:hypothetical protein